jgi:hypothetical protein
VEIKNKNTNISTALITVDRENLFRLFVKNPKEVNETLLDFLQFLDDTEIALALEETNNTTLEIIHKDLVLANGFLNANQPQLARNILEKSESLLETIQLSPEEVIVQNVVRQKESLFTKLLACESFGACGDTEFSEWFQKQKIIACQIENACNAEMFEKWLTALLDTNLKASAEIDPRNFLEEEYEHPEERALSLLESEAMVLEDGSPSEEVGFFDIHKATTGSGFTFSGKLSLKHSYLKEITLDDGTEILGTIALHSLEQVIYRTRVPEQNSGATIEGDYDNISEDSPDAIQSSLSPAVIDIVVRAIQPKFLDAGLIVFRSDIIPISSTKGVVQHALVGPEKTAVSFEYTATDDSTIEVLKNVVLKEYPSISLPEVSLEEAEEKIIELATWEKEKGRLVFDSLKLLEREGFIVQKEKLTALVEKETVVFSDVYDEKNNLTLVGEISPSSFIFLKVADTTGIWSFENISVNQYSSLVNSPQNTEELSEEGSDPEAETDSTPESEEQVSAE